MTLHEDELSRELRNKEQHLQTVESMLLESDVRVKELEEELRLANRNVSEMGLMIKKAIEVLGGC